MVQIKSRVKESLKLLSLRAGRVGRRSTVGIHRRKAKQKIYRSPRIILSSDWVEFIGKKGRVFGGRAEWRGGSTPRKGDCLVIFFPDHWPMNQK